MSLFYVATLQPVVDYFRSRGIRVVIFVDDFIVLAPHCLIGRHKTIVIDTLKRLGFIVNYKKSSLEPSQRKINSGHIIDNSGAYTVISVNGFRGTV